MTQIYSNPTRATDPHALPDVETFYVGTVPDYRMQLECFACRWNADERHATEGHSEHVGWYWQSGPPGCLPDGEPNGPFETEQVAIDDAQSGAEIEATPSKLDKWRERAAGPGKFEGEPIYAPYFYDLGLDGGGDETWMDEYDRAIDVFKLTPSDWCEFDSTDELDCEDSPLRGIYAVLTWENSNGFFTRTVETEAELDRLRAETDHTSDDTDNNEQDATRKR